MATHVVIHYTGRYIHAYAPKQLREVIVPKDITVVLFLHSGYLTHPKPIPHYPPPLVWQSRLQVLSHQ